MEPSCSAGVQGDAGARGHLGVPTGVFGGCPALLSTPSLCPPSVSVEQLGEPQVMGPGQEGDWGQMVASCRAMWNESHSLGSVLGTREAFSMCCC